MYGLFHGLIGWSFLFFLLVNTGDLLEGFIPDWTFLGDAALGLGYRLLADLFAVAALVGMAAFLLRRFAIRDRALVIRETTPVLPAARRGIPRDSLIVGAFILVHIGARFLGASFAVALAGSDLWQPFATLVSGAWASWSPLALTFAEHISWWLAIGTILVFLPYFTYSKHIHLFLAPINYLLHPARRSMGELDPLDFDDASIEEFGVARLEQLSWKGILDSYACIMCNRCQDACPAYSTGKVLSPAALEINKRYYLNSHGAAIAAGANSPDALTEFAIPYEAVWACTACGACVEVCPVANEPMRDILEIRRHQVLMQNDFPDDLQTAYRGMERSANPWSVSPEERMDWAQGLGVQTVKENPDADLLWWVGCAPSTDPRAQHSARAFAELLKIAEVKFAVLGPEERCTGDSARRSGNEYLFQELAMANIDTLNRVNPKRIVTTCPHCLHTLQNEYPAFGGDYKVVHHTELLAELMEAGRLAPESGGTADTATFHDPCFLGRQNGIVEPPRALFRESGIPLIEMPRSQTRSFCCGAGGAQMWKEEESGSERVSEARVREAADTNASTLAVACPFCTIMLEDAVKTLDIRLEVRDVTELLWEANQRKTQGDSPGPQSSDV